MITNGRYFGFNVNYRFGEMKAEIKKVKTGISNDDEKSKEGQSGS